MREAFSLLHPLASRPSFYSPNKMFDFQLSAPQLDAIETVDKGISTPLALLHLIRVVERVSKHEVSRFTTSPHNRERPTENGD